MVVIKTIGTKGPFVYGQLYLKPKSFARPTAGDQRVAVEILREFSSTEFVGRLYVNVGTWIPAAWPYLSPYKWYQVYEKSKGAGIALLHFAMDGSGIWKVNFLRDESDDSGPYIAIGLKLGE